MLLNVARSVPFPFKEDLVAVTAQRPVAKRADQAGELELKLLLNAPCGHPPTRSVPLRSRVMAAGNDYVRARGGLLRPPGGSPITAAPLCV